MKEWLSKRTIFDVRCRSCDFNGPVPMLGQYVSIDAPMEINFNGVKCPSCGNVDVVRFAEPTYPGPRRVYGGSILA